MPGAVGVALAAALCLTASSDAGSDTVTGEVRISVSHLDLAVSPDAVPGGRPARVSALLAGAGSVSDVAITLHAPVGTAVRPSTTVERDRARGDVRATWLVCREATGLALLAATATFTDGHGRRRSLTSPAQLLEVTADGRGCPGR